MNWRRPWDGDQGVGFVSYYGLAFAANVAGVAERRARDEIVVTEAS